MSAAAAATTDLFAAIHASDALGVARALARGACVTAVDDKGRTPLLCALVFTIIDGDDASSGIDIMTRLLKAGCCVRATIPCNGNTSLHLAVSCMWRHAARAPEVVAHLLKAGSCVHARNSRDQTPLHMCFRQHAYDNVGDVIALLLGAGANVDAPARDGKTPLHCAVKSGNVAAVVALLAAGANVRAVNAKGGTPLLIAVRNGDANMVRTLVAAGGNVRARVGVDGSDTLLNTALRQRDEDVVRALIECGAGLDVSGEGGPPHPLEVACSALSAPLVALLCDAGCRVRHHVPAEGDTLLHYVLLHTTRHAQQAAAGDTMTALVRAGARVDAPNAAGDTPLMCATRRKYSRIVQALVSAGADTRKKNGAGVTPLDVAFKSRHAATLNAMVCNAASYRVAEEFDDLQQDDVCDLVAAAKGGDLLEVLTLLHPSLHVDMDSVVEEDEEGGTPLWHAASRGHVRVVRALLAAGACTFTRAKDGTTPHDVAVARGHVRAARALQIAQEDAARTDSETEE